MSDRIKGFVVVLEKDMKDEDFETVKNAVQAIRGVLKVEPSVVTPHDWMNREQVKGELRQQLWKTLE